LEIEVLLIIIAVTIGLFIIGYALFLWIVSIFEDNKLWLNTDEEDDEE